MIMSIVGGYLLMGLLICLIAIWNDVEFHTRKPHENDIEFISFQVLALVVSATIWPYLLLRCIKWDK